MCMLVVNELCMVSVRYLYHFVRFVYEYDACMYCVIFAYGLCRVLVRCVYGVCMVCVWVVYDVCMCLYDLWMVCCKICV